MCKELCNLGRNRATAFDLKEPGATMKTIEHQLQCKMIPAAVKAIYKILWRREKANIWEVVVVNEMSVRRKFHRGSDL